MMQGSPCPKVCTLSIESGHYVMNLNIIIPPSQKVDNNYVIATPLELRLIFIPVLPINAVAIVTRAFTIHNM